MSDKPEQPEIQVDPGKLEVAGPLVPGSVISSREQAVVHRFWVQTQIGKQVARAVLLALLLVVALVFVLALEDRSVGYIKGVAESLQPYVLPAFGVLVGYALPRPPGDS